MAIDTMRADQGARIVVGLASRTGRIVEIASPQPSLWSSDGLLAAPSEVRWHVLHTRARQEKAVARTLHAAKVEHYLPLVQRTATCGRRTRIVTEPVFSSYLFLRGPVEATYFALATKRVANVINVPDQDLFIQELQQIRRALETGAELSPHRYLEVGRRVRIKAGPLKGLEGMIEQRPKGGRLVLQVAALGRATSLEIDADLLEPMDEREA